MKKIAPLAAAALLGFAGCTPDIPPQVVALKPQSLGLGSTPAPAVGEWWKAFDDPQLDGLVSAALADNPSLAQGLARMRSAQAGLSSARSQQYPQVSLDGQEQWEKFSGRYIIPPPYGGSSWWVGTAEADLSWNIDFWGKQAALVGKAKSLAGAASLDAAGARLAVAAAIVDAYVQLDAAYRLAGIAHETVIERQSSLALTQRRLHDGLDSKIELNEAQAQLDAAREDEQRALVNRELGSHAIAALVGRGADAYRTIAPPSLHLDAALTLPSTLPADLLARRPDILAAEMRIDAAMEGRKAAEAAFYPDVNLTAAAGTAALGLGNLFTSAATQYSAGPAVHLPIFDAGKLRADYAGATADLDLAVADYNSAVIDAVRETSDRLSQIRSLDAQEAEQAHFGRDAEQGYRLAQTRYRTGLANQLTLLNAQSVVLQARQQQAVLDAARAAERSNLVLAIGGGFDAGSLTSEKSCANSPSPPRSGGEGRGEGASPPNEQCKHSTAAAIPPPPHPDPLPQERKMGEREADEDPSYE